MQRALLWHTYAANYVRNDVNLFGESPSTHSSSRMCLKKKIVYLLIVQYELSIYIYTLY